MQPADLHRGGVLSPAEERRARRWPRRLALGLLAFAALVAALIGGAWAYLQSDAGEARVRAMALGAVKDALQGKVEVGRISLSGLTVELTDVRLSTPEGEPVATLARVRARLSLLPLLHHTIRIDSVEVDRPVLTLVSDGRGLNLSRAIAATHPAPPGPSEPSAWSVQVDQLTLKDGAVSFRQPEGTPREVSLASLGGEGSAFVGGGADGTLRADLALNGAMATPLQGPVTVKLTARGERGETRLTVALDGPGMALRAEAHAQGPEKLDVKISSLSLSPGAVRAVVPDYPLQVPLTLQGTLAQNGSWNTVALQAQAGDARLTLDGTLDLAQLEARGLELHAQGVDLRQLTGKGEKTALTLDLEGELKGRSLETLSGALTLKVPPSRVAGQPVGPLSLRARAKDGQVTLEALKGQLPGVSFQGDGTLNTRTLDLQATLNATDLDALSRTLGPLTGSALPKLSGKGQLTLRLRGPTRHPSLTAKGTVRSLRAGENGVKGLSLDVKVPDVRKPLETDASISASELSIGGQRLKDLVTRLETRGRRLIADLRTQGAAQISLHLEGLLDPGGEGVNVDTLLLTWPEERWRLDRPAHVTFAGERLEVAPLVLRSGAQRLFLQGRKVGTRVNAHVAVGGLVLERLPALLTRPYGLQGTLDAEVTASGRLSRPSVIARVALQDGAAFGYSGLSLTLDGRYADDRATGTLTAAALGADAHGTFDLPIQGLGQRRRGAVKVDLEVADRSLGELLCQLSKRPQAEALCRGGTPAATGSASATLRIEGDAAAPQLALTVRGEKLELPKLPTSEVTLTVRTDERDALSATLELSALGGHAKASLSTPLLLGEVLRRPPTAAALQKLPVALSLEGADLTLTPLSRAGLLPRRVRGTLSFEGEVRGTAVSPEGRLTVRLGRARYLGSPPLALALEANATQAAVTAHLTANQAGKPLADLRAQLDRGLSALRDPDRLGEVPFRLEGNAGPLDLSDPAFSSRDEEVPPEQTLHGSLTFALGASGTLAKPRAEARLTLDGFGVGKAEDAPPLAHGEATFRYADAQATLRAALKGQAGGTLALDGHTTLDLSYPSLRRGLALEKAPLGLALQARRFDLGFLSGLSPVARTVGGTLEADATAGGTFSRPTWRGALEWRDGALNLTGLGEYHDVHLALNAVNDQIDLTDFSAQAGGGKLTLTASAHRAGDRWRMNGKAEASAFPVISDDQLVATASLRSTFDGEITRQRVNVQHLHIPEAHFELPQVARKDLQSLQRPEDVVLVRDGRMVDRSQRRDPILRADLGTVLGKSAQIAPAQPETEPGLEYWVTVDAPRNVWIRGEDVNAEIGFSEGFRVEYGQKPLLYGEVRVIRARLEVLGRRFDLRNDSSVRFAGEVLQPFVNVTGVYKNEPAQVTVYLTIRGQGKDVSLHVSSDPPLSESQIYTLLATGRITLKRGSGAAMSGGQAASIIGSLAASQLKKSLASKLPLDVLSIEAGEEGLQGSKLEAGTYVTDKIYVGYTGRLGADRSKGENANAVKLEYQVSPHWSLEVEYGDARAGGADLIWSKDY